MSPIKQLKAVLCDPTGKCCIDGSDEDRAIVDKALQALAQLEQEPYCWVQSKLNQGLFYKEKPRRIHTIPLYTAPPRKPWVGLTDEEIEDLDDFDYCEYGFPNNFVRAIEAKLKEKNGGISN